MLQIKVGAVLFGALYLSLSLPVNSAVYKCKDKSGHVSYSQAVCPQETKVDKIIRLRGTGAGDKHDVQCGLVKSFAAEVGLAVNRNQSVNDFAGRYGGVSQLSPLALTMIRSVYEYQSQPYKTVQNSVEYEKERCLSEVYGVPECSEFPMQFITANGGCAAAADTNLLLKRMSASSSNSKLRSDNKKTNQRVANAAQDARARAELERQKSRTCKESTKMALRRNEQHARASNSASMQDQLRQERRSLRQKFANCS